MARKTTLRTRDQVLHGTADTSDTENEIRHLPDLILSELRQRWQRLFGKPCPRTLHRKFLVKAIAFQMQLDAMGGIPPMVRGRLHEIADAARRGDVDAALGLPGIRPGTQLVRRWKDQTLIVTTLERGFAFEGQTYTSLSAIAKAITGTSWNGYAFFGIRKRSRSNKNAAGPRWAKEGTITVGPDGTPDIVVSASEFDPSVPDGPVVL